MAKETTNQQDRELMSLALDFLKDPKSSKDKETRALAAEVYIQERKKGEKPVPKEEEALASSVASQFSQVVDEIPTNTDISALRLLSGLSNMIAAAGVNLDYGTSGGETPEQSERRINQNLAGDFTSADPKQFDADYGALRAAGSSHSDAIKFMSETNMLTRPEGPKITNREMLGRFTHLARGMAKTFEGGASDLQSGLPETSLKSHPIVQIFRSVEQNTGPMVASVGIGMLTGQPHLGIALLAGTTFGDTFFEQREGGATTPNSAFAAAMNAGIEVATESIVFPKLLKGLNRGFTARQVAVLVGENATQEGFASYGQTYVSTLGLARARGLSWQDANALAIDAGLAAIPEGMVTGAGLAFGASGSSAAVRSVFDMTSVQRKEEGTLVSQAPGSIVEEPTIPPPSAEAQNPNASAVPAASSETIEGTSQAVTILNNQRDIAEGQNLDSTVKPPDVMAAEIVDQSRQVAAGPVDQGEPVTPESEAATNRISLFESEKNKKLSEEDNQRALAFLEERIAGEPKIVKAITEAKAKVQEEPADLKKFISDEEIEKSLTTKTTRPLVSDPSAKEAQAKKATQKARKIKSLQSDLGLNDRDYRKALYETTQKNSTTAMSLTEMDAVITDFNLKKSEKFLADEPVRLQLTESEASEVKGFSKNSKSQQDTWRNVLENQLNPLPKDPFSHKKMWNVLKTKARKQDAFKKQLRARTSPNALTNATANAAADVGNFFASFKSYRNFFSDLDQQTGVPVFTRYQNLIDASTTAKADSQRAFANVLALHGKTKMPGFRGFQMETVHRLNKALYFGKPLETDLETLSPEQIEANEIIKTFTPEEREHYDTLRDLFTSNPNKPNTGPNAVRLRAYQWRVWNRSYNENTPKIAELTAENEQLTKDLLIQEAKDKPAKLGTKKDLNALDKEIAKGDPKTLVELLRKRQALATSLETKTETKKADSKLASRIARNKKSIKKFEKDIKDATPIQGSEEGKASKTPSEILQAGKKAQQDGRFYDWLRSQTFGTRDIYFVTEDKFNTWLKSVADGMKPGELGAVSRAPSASISDVATRNRVTPGSPLMNKNPYSVAQTRLTKLSLLDELFSPLNDMNQDISKAWDNMSDGQTKSYSKWMDNMIGVYDDAGSIIKPLQTVQKQWWRAYGWNPQRIAKFWARNLGQITLVSGQVPVSRFTKAAPIGYAGFHLQAAQARREQGQQAQTPELESLELQDLQNQLREAVNKSGDRSTTVIDPWLYEDWRLFAQTEVSQKAAQYALLTQQENTRQGSAALNWQDAMPSLMGVSDTLGRWATWVPLHQMAHTNMKLLRAGQIQDKQLWSRLSLDTLENPQKDALMALKENGQDRQFIRQYANMKTKNVHYAYDLNERSQIEQHAAGRLLAGVITWPRSAMENYVRLAKNGSDAVHEQDLGKALRSAAGIMKYMAAFGMLGVLSSKVSRDPWYGIWRSINPVGFFGSPQMSHIEELQQNLQNLWDGDLQNLPTEREIEVAVSTLADSLGVLALPAASLYFEGWKTMVEARHGLKGVESVDLIKSTWKGKSVLYLGGEEAWRTQQEKYLKFFFDEEAQETRDVERIPGI